MCCSVVRITWRVNEQRTSYAGLLDAIRNTRNALNPGLAAVRFPPTVPRVIGFLRFVGMVNAAVWLGAAVFFTFAGGPALFSDEMKTLLGPHNFPYFSGAIAQVLVARCFKLQLVCGLVALLHLFAEWLYLGRPLRRFTSYLLAGLLLCSLAGDFWMQPKIKSLHHAQYTSATAQSRATAASAGRFWHGAAQGVNFLMLAGLGVYLWRVGHPLDTTRYVGGLKLRP